MTQVSTSSVLLRFVGKGKHPSYTVTLELSEYVFFFFFLKPN